MQAYLTQSCKVDNMSGLVLLVQLTRLRWISRERVQRVARHKSTEVSVPEISFRRARKYPRLAGFLAKTRALWLGVDDVLDGFAHQAGAAGDEDNGGHRVCLSCYQV